MALKVFFLEYPEVYEESLRKNVQLDKNLKDVYVTSYDVILLLLKVL